MSGTALIAALPPSEAPPISRAGRADLRHTPSGPLPHSNASFDREVQRNFEASLVVLPSPSSAIRNMPQRAASKVEGPQELRQAVHLIVMFAVRNGGDLALEGREPGGLSWAGICWWLRGHANNENH